MSPLEQLFCLEVIYHRKLRALAPGTVDTLGLHTSYALQSGYEPLIRAIGTASIREIDQVLERFVLVGDARDLLAASDSLKHMLSIRSRDA